MKRSINNMIIALLMIGGLHANSMFGAQRDNVLVDTLRKQSDLTEADENQYKLTWLGNWGAFISGAAATIGAGAGATHLSETVLFKNPNWALSDMKTMKDWVASPLMLGGLGAATVGYASYKLLYPRVRAGILYKVKKFMDLCRELGNNTPTYPNDDFAYNIFNYSFNNLNLSKEGNLKLLKQYLPNNWHGRTDYAVYKALDYLWEQGDIARNLLEQIGETNEELTGQYGYVASLLVNKTLYEKNYPNFVEALKNEKSKQKIVSEAEMRVAQHANLQADTGVKTAAKWSIYSSMVKDAVKNTYNGLKYVYDNKEAIIAQTTVASVAALGMYAYIKSKLGY